MKLMIVEDSPLVRERIVEMLNNCVPTESLFVAESAERALSLAEAHSLDVVLLDLWLMDGHGFDVLRALKTQQESVQVVVMTLDPSEQYKKRALQLGASHFFDKIKDYKVIIEVIGGLVGRANTNSTH
ncbi:MAG: hypothetical protein Kow0065_04930 [Methylomicrobium sp.]